MFIPWIIALFLGLVSPSNHTHQCNGGGTVQVNGTGDGGEDGGDDGDDGPGSGTGTGGGTSQNPPPPPPPPPHG